MSAAAPTDTFALLVPCYNAARYLSLLRKQVGRLFPAFDEVLLADDGSADGTADSARALGFRVIELERNGGPGAARNALARACTATWIHFHDVDDEIAPDYLTHVRPFALADVDAVLSDTDFIHEQTRQLITHWECSAAAYATDAAAAALHYPVPVHSSLVRRSVFLGLGGFDERRRCWEDGDFHFRLAASGARIRCTERVLEWSLRHDRGASADSRYCYRCRLAFLNSYAESYPKRLHQHIAFEAEKVAVALLELGDVRCAGEALALGAGLGRAVPSTQNRLLRALRFLLPPLALLRFQSWWRRLHLRQPS